MSKEEIKDMIEPIPNWEFTYRYDGSRNCGKSYTQSLLDEKDKEIERLNNIINELEKEIDIAIKELQPNELVNGINLLKNIKFTLKELKENK